MKKVLLIGIIAICLIACNQVKKEYLVTDTQVGKLYKDTKVSQLDSIYVEDSIVNLTHEDKLQYVTNNSIQIFEKNGKQLLEITPKINKDNEKNIESVQILDPRFTTNEGISLTSKFKDIKLAYPNLELQQTVKSLIVTPKGHTFYFIIDKSELNNPSIGIFDEVTLDDIPSMASIKYFILNWN